MDMDALFKAPKKGKGRRQRIDNPYNAAVETMNVLLGDMRATAKKHRTGTPISPCLRKKLEFGQFKKITANPSRHTMLRAKDGAIVGYRVPAALIDGEALAKRPRSLIKSLPEIPPWRLKKNRQSKKMIGKTRVYSIWLAYHTNREPHMSAQYLADGEKAKEFVEGCKPLWEEAGRILKTVFPGTHKRYTNYALENGLTRLAGPWMGMAINEGCEDDPVVTEKHQDSKDAFYGVSCICPFGDYEGGDLICWELEAVVELKPGDLFFFPAHLVTHSNTQVKGERHSLVAFTRQEIIDWFKKAYHCTDDRDKLDERATKRQKSNR